MRTIDEVIEYLRHLALYSFLGVAVMIVLTMFGGVWHVYTSLTFIVFIFMSGLVLGFAISIVLISSAKKEVEQ